MTALLVGTCLSAIEVTIVGTAMPTIIARLGGVSLYAWVYAAYMLTATTSVPLYGKLADLYGRKPVLLWAMGSFMVGTAACGAAWNIESLIAFRALQGLGAGGVIPISLTIAGDMHSPEERPRVQSFFSLIWGGASATGPFLGAFLVNEVSWRSVFYVNIPFGIVAMALLWLHYRDPEVRSEHGLDLPGAFLLVGGCTLLLLGLLRAPSSAVGESALEGARTTLLVGGVVLLAVFAWWEMRAKEPLFPPAVLATRVIALSAVWGALSGMVLYTLTMFIPLSVQGVQQGTPLRAGIVLLTISIGWTGSSLIAGRTVPIFGIGRHMLTSGISMVLGASLLLGIGPESGVGRAVAGMILVGVGMGTGTIAAIVAIQNQTPWHQRGVGTSALPFFRAIGGSLGVGLCGALFNSALADATGGSLLSRFQAVGIDNVDDAVRRLLDPVRRAELPEALRDDLAAAVGLAVDPVLVTVLASAAGCLLLVLWWPRPGRSASAKARQAAR